MRDTNELKGLDGMEYIATAPNRETIINLTEFKGKLYVATDKHVYVLVDDKRLEEIG